VPLREIFSFDQRHIDRTQAFLLAGLAGDAEIHRLVEAGIGEGARAGAFMQRRLERRHARLGRMFALAGDPVAWAHHALARILTIAAMHTHGDCLGIITASRWNAGIGIADAISVISRPIEKGFHALASGPAQITQESCLKTGWPGSWMAGGAGVLLSLRLSDIGR
jgi:hypothetical protein